jgi:hypothetical protein
MSETFADYETLMANMEENPKPLTLPCILEMARESPRSAANKRNRGNPAAGDETTRGGPSYRGASGSGTGGTTTEAGNTATMAQGATPKANILTRAGQIAAFVANPMMPQPHQVKMDHITYLLAIVLGGALQEAADKAAHAGAYS